MNATFEPAANVLRVSFATVRQPVVPAESCGVTIREAIAACVESKLAMGLRKKYVSGLRAYLMLFAEGREETPVDEFTTQDVEDWFNQRGEIPVTRNANLGRLSALFEFARRRKWVKENVCRDVEKSVIDRQPPKILSVAQCELLMQRVCDIEPTLLPVIVLGLFMGIRPEEIQRLQPEDIDMEAGLVQISAAASKVRRRRFVTINDTARAWLEINHKLPVTNLRRKLRRVRCDLKRRRWEAVIEWSNDILRHTAASHLYASHGAIYTSRELGNSETMLFRHYRELVKPAEMLKFWRIVPPDHALRMSKYQVT